MRDEIPKEEWEIFIEILNAYSKLRDYIMEVMGKHLKSENELVYIIYNHLKFIAERSATISIIIQSNLLWDAEMILRAVLEATMKLLYLCNATEDERVQRLHEYLNDFPEINSLKHSEQAKKIVASMDSTNELAIPFLPIILDPEKEKSLRDKWNKKQRKELEQRWAFTEILREQAEKMKDFKDIVLNLSHPYRLSSHLIHADEMGIGIIAERASRTKEEIIKIERVHFCSIMSNNFYYLFLSGISVMNYLKEEVSPLIKIKDSLNNTFLKIKAYDNMVIDGPDYAKFKK